jgi:hypothetical protein
MQIAVVRLVKRAIARRDDAVERDLHIVHLKCDVKGDTCTEIQPYAGGHTCTAAPTVNVPSIVFETCSPRRSPGWCPDTATVYVPAVASQLPSARVVHSCRGASANEISADCPTPSIVFSNPCEQTKTNKQKTKTKNKKTKTRTKI